MKLLLAILLLAVACLTASTLAWLRATSSAAAALDDGRGPDTIAALQRSRQPDHDIDLSARYAGRPELLDPRVALPTWHEHPREEAVRVHAATKACPAYPLFDLTDSALAKAYAWHRATCAPGTTPADALVDHPPFMHPSGRSYALLAVTRPGGVPASWIHEHTRSFHVLELATLDAAALDPDDRALAALPEHAWEALSRGDSLVLTSGSLIIADRTQLGLARLRVYSRPAWEGIARDAAIALRTREPSTLCARPASPELCWHPLSVADRHGAVLLVSTAASGALVVMAAVALGIAYLRERRRMHADRVHVLRTLTHELRTPATSLRVDIEPLRAAYDELPVTCQEPLLRISDGIERLHRVLHRSARYMALFETRATSQSALVKLAEVPSARTMFEELSEEWPEGVTLDAASADGSVVTDPEWLGVAVRNLVENATRHGAPPVLVSWALRDDGLVIRVSDGGRSTGFSLARSVAPYDRDPRSPGLGLGLAIVDRIAHLLGGRLAHEPSPTTFELRVPTKGAVA